MTYNVSMANRNHDISTIGEYYHCFNRGTDKRTIFEDQQDYVYFLKSLKAYNSTEVTGRLRLQENKTVRQPLVSIVTYCLLPNHYHIVLRNEVEGGVSQYLKRVSGGYTMYFNQKYRRSGALFQGKFKSCFISSDQDLQQVTGYVYFNHKIHEIGDPALWRSSLNTKLDIVRGWTSNLDYDPRKLDEIADLIKEQRLTLE